jgi:uncharacterized SAM-binding protein YcdF (DUF218 family)
VLQFVTVAACAWAVFGSKRAWIVAATTAALLVLIGIAPAGGWLMIPLEGRFPPWQSTSQSPPNGIIALGGDTGHRLYELARLSRLFPQARLVYTGAGNLAVSTAELRHADIDTARVIIETASRTTTENAINTAALVRPKATEMWLLITSAAHMPRAIGCFRHAGFNVTAVPVDYHTDRTSYLYASTAAQRIAQFDDAVREWVGLVGYRIAGATDALFPHP